MLMGERLFACLRIGQLVSTASSTKVQCLVMDCHKPGHQITVNTASLFYRLYIPLRSLRLTSLCDIGYGSTNSTMETVV